MRGLHLDHDLIFARIGWLKEMWLSLDAEKEADRRCLLSELFLLQKFMEIHHEIEERFLFPSLKPISSQVQNGPHCSLHMMQRIIEPPLAKAKARVAFFGGDPEANRARAREIESHNQIGSYLSIPLEEHEAGAVYFSLLQKLLSSTKPDWPATELMLTVHSYLSLIDQHASKEDQCLFPQCETLKESQPIEIVIPESYRREWEEERRAFSVKR